MDGCKCFVRKTWWRRCGSNEEAGDTGDCFCCIDTFGWVSSVLMIRATVGLLGAQILCSEVDLMNVNWSAKIFNLQGDVDELDS